MAASRGHLEIAGVLIDRGAAVDCKDEVSTCVVSVSVAVIKYIFL